MMLDIVRDGAFGAVKAFTWTIEFQKRGLPHSHVLVTLEDQYKFKNKKRKIDEFIQAETPQFNEKENAQKVKVFKKRRKFQKKLSKQTFGQPIIDGREGVYPSEFECVRRKLIHGPCGYEHKFMKDCPCMNKKYDLQNKICEKKYPKKYQEETEFPEFGYPLYRRRKTKEGGKSFILRKKFKDIGAKDGEKSIVDYKVTNKWVVPHNLQMVRKFQTHLNVEVCASFKVIKYLFMYILKGHDRVSFKLNKVLLSKTSKDCEIEKYLDCRYIGCSEAHMRLLYGGKSLFNMKPQVKRLDYHLKNEQKITLTEADVNLQKKKKKKLKKLIRKKRKSMFLSWMNHNKKELKALENFYTDFMEGSAEMDTSMKRDCFVELCKDYECDLLKILNSKKSVEKKEKAIQDSRSNIFEFDQRFIYNYQNCKNDGFGFKKLSLDSTHEEFSKSFG